MSHVSHILKNKTPAAFFSCVNTLDRNVSRAQSKDLGGRDLVETFLTACLFCGSLPGAAGSF